MLRLGKMDVSRKGCRVCPQEPKYQPLKCFSQRKQVIIITLVERFHCAQLLASKPASSYEWLFVYIIAGLGP